jgi:hypothetical protein
VSALGPEVVEVESLPCHRLRLKFEDGAQGEVDVSRLVSFEGVFAPLRDPEFFARVAVDPELGTVVWPNGADLAPESLRAAIENGA